ncbi:S41 family peptidase [Tsuneonella amylolytica]|uniref:S41 family peptidase n=1 Tax=Tsuneonella amylolytica TaxID=2338327 RepID=UPI000EA8705F|nr:S41 family peptidase [Tsuneonella amylolytica]
MSMGRTSLALIMAGMVTACGGGGGSGGGSFGGGNTGATPVPTPTPTPPATASCSISSQQDFAKASIDEWFLYPNLINASVNKANYSTVQAYIDAYLAPFFAEKKNAQFTYVTSIKEENAYYQSGSSAGIGVRLALDSSNRLYVTEAFENAPALAAGIDRGTEIVGIGTTASNVQSVQSIIQAGGGQALTDALGPNSPGVTRYFQINNKGTVTTVAVTKTEFALDPVSDRYGAKIIDNNGMKVGYVNLRTFIDTADDDLRAAFNSFKSQGVTQVIVDLRYNGGGLVRTSELFGDLLAADKVGKVFSYTTFRDSKAQYNETKPFASQPQAISAMKIAFIGTRATASASELLINSFTPYLGANTALVGTNTYGKPVGQVALDNAPCDQRMRVVAFKTENASRQGDYFSGLAAYIPNTCAAGDDITHQLGDPQEASIKAALGFLAGGTCTPITSSNGQRTQATASARTMLEPAAPSAAQRETPGMF